MKALRIVFRLGLLIGFGVVIRGLAHDRPDARLRRSRSPRRRDCAS